MDHKIKILVIGPDSPHLEKFISRIDIPSYQMEIISSGGTHVSYHPITKLNFSLSKLLNFFVTRRKIKQIAVRFQPDIVWVHQANSYALYTVIALRKKFPIVLTAWGSDILVAPLKSKLIKLITQFILKNIDFITADAKFLGEKARALVPKKKIPLEICQLGIDPLNVSLEKKNIVYSNRGHKPLYRIKEVIEAFERFSSSQKENWRLIVAGYGTETENLKSLVDKLQLTDQVEFVGFLSPIENAKWYGQAKVFVSIPESDGTAVSLLEAMYYGCIPVVSDLPANHEWIKHNINGHIVTDLKDNFIADSLSIDTGILQTINKEIITQSATPESCQEKFIEVINKVLKEK